MFKKGVDRIRLLGKSKPSKESRMAKTMRYGLITILYLKC